MSLVSNFIGNISSTGINSFQSIPDNFDLNDKTFENLLQKQIEGINKEGNETSVPLNLGMPSGFEIDSFDLPVEQITNPNPINDIEDKTTSETVTFFSSLMDTKENPQSEIFDFAKKQAANLYHKYSKSVVTDVSEFLNDIKRTVN